MEDEEQSTPAWRPIGRTERRVLGVLVEKAKTTPDAYPLTLNALRNGCNQKSNRFPQMTLEEHHVLEACDNLREAKAAVLIQGDSRVEKFRHLAYDWLGVDKVELAVMAELLLRGAQTIGELRGRAARMEPIPGMTELRPILQSLVDKNLVIYLTPPGRGAVVTHNLYEPQELEKVRRESGGGAVEQPKGEGESLSPAPASEPQTADDALAKLRAELMQEIAALRAEVKELRELIQ